MRTDSKDAGTQTMLSNASNEQYQFVEKPRPLHQCVCNRFVSRKQKLEISPSFNMTFPEIKFGTDKVTNSVQIASITDRRVPVPISRPCAITPNSSEITDTFSINCSSNLRSEKPEMVRKRENHKSSPINSNAEMAKLAGPDSAICNLSALQALLCRIFKGDNLSLNDFKLTTSELHILVEIFIRKNKLICQAQ